MSDRDTEIIANISREIVPDATPPTSEEIVTWAHGRDCPDTALADMTWLAAGMMAPPPPDIWPTPQQRVSPPAYMYMGLALDADDRAILTLNFYLEIAGERVDPPAEFLPSAFLADVTDTWNELDPETRPDHPLVPLVRAWHNRPTEVDPERHERGIIPERLAHATPEANRTASKSPDGLLFTPAHYARAPKSPNAQLPLLPGFGMEHPPPAPTLPVQLLKLGEVGDGHGRGAPMAPRLALDAVMSAPLSNRKAGQPVAMTFTLAEIVEWLYPDKAKRPSPRKYWERLIEARRLLNSDDALIPLIDPKTGKATLRQVIAITEFPAQPDLAGDVRIVVDLPAGHGDGPQIDRLTLRRFGLVSAPAWRLYLGLAYLWHNPGVTVHPGREGLPWLQSDDPNAYPDTPAELLVRLAFPDVEKPERYHGQRMRKALGAIIDGNIAQEISGKIVPVRRRESASVAS